MSNLYSDSDIFDMRVCSSILYYFVLLFVFFFGFPFYQLLANKVMSFLTFPICCFMSFRSQFWLAVFVIYYLDVESS